jgi:hypothetical protein
MIILVIAIAVCIVSTFVFVAILYLDDSIKEPDECKKPKSRNTAPIQISDAGVISVKSADILKSKNGQRHLRALKNSRINRQG